jgi:hypothetical protein
MTAVASLAVSTGVAALRERHDDLLVELTRDEARVRRLRRELTEAKVARGAATPPAARRLIWGVRDLIEARAQLAQVRDELRMAESR